jgi:hypothetical protein
MRFLLPFTTALGLALAAAPSASAQLVSPTAEFGAGYTHHDGVTTVLLDLELASGPIYFLLVSASDFQTLPVLLGPLPLDESGNSLFVAAIPPSIESLLPELFKLSFRPLFLAGNYVSTTQAASFVLNDAGCESIDFDLEAGGAPTVAGEQVLEQWGAIGLHITCESQDPINQPNKAIVFDSTIPSPADPDLVTPGYGTDNDTALGKLLIVAENDIDADNDGLVDEPDDAFNGGIIRFNWDSPVDVCSATFVDVDDEPGQGITRLRFYQDAAGTQFIASLICPPGDDNNVKTLFFKVPGVMRMDVKFGGSGGLGGASWCPTCINFDDTGMGIQLGMPAGTIVTSQFANLGIQVSATDKLGAPRQAILFDSANPTGNDGDLVTPGYGAGNTDPEGMILIISQDDTDADNDGLVDDPNDEATGGNMFFDFDFPVLIEDLTFIDVDGLESSWVQGIDENNQVVGTVPLANLGDNSRQTITIKLPNVTRFKVHLGGSGSVAGFCVCSNPPNAAN